MFELILAVLAGLIILDVVIELARQRIDHASRCDQENHRRLMHELRRHGD